MKRYLHRLEYPFGMAPAEMVYAMEIQQQRVDKETQVRHVAGLQTDSSKCVACGMKLTSGVCLDGCGAPQ